MQSMDFDRCISVKGLPGIWMVREQSHSRVAFLSWQDYVAAGRPPYDTVTEKEMNGYRIAGQFRPLHRS